MRLVTFRLRLKYLICRFFYSPLRIFLKCCSSWRQTVTTGFYWTLPTNEVEERLETVWCNLITQSKNSILIMTYFMNFILHCNLRMGPISESRDFLLIPQNKKLATCWRTGWGLLDTLCILLNIFRDEYFCQVAKMRTGSKMDLKQSYEIKWIDLLHIFHMEFDCIAHCSMM